MVATTPAIRIRMLSVAAAVVALLAGTDVASARTLDEAMKGLARDVQSFLAARKETGVVVERFDGPDGTSSASLMRKKFLDELRALKVETPKTGLKVRGSFTLGNEGGQSVIEISLTMKGRDNNDLQQFNALALQKTVDSPEDVAIISGATVGQPGTANDVKAVAEGKGDTGNIDPVTNPNPAAVAADPKKALADAIKAPTFTSLGQTGSIVGANKATPYRVELLARPQGQLSYVPRPVTDEKGLAFCNVKPGEEYALKIYNDSEYDCAVKLTIDGLNCFEFSDVPEFKTLGMWVVPKNSSLLCRGWYRSNQLSESFLVTGLPESAVGKLGRDTGRIGTITACFFAAWEAQDARPSIEPIGARDRATARGISQAEDFSTVLRYIGLSMQSSISIRYSKPGDLPQKALR